MKKIDSDIEFYYNDNFYSINKHQINFKCINQRYMPQEPDLTYFQIEITMNNTNNSIELLFDFDKFVEEQLEIRKDMLGPDSEAYLAEYNLEFEKLKNNCINFYNSIFFNYIK